VPRAWQYKDISRIAKERIVWLAAFVIVGTFYFWIIGIGADRSRFAWNSGLDQHYGLPTPAIAKGSWDINGYYDLLGRAFASGKLALPVKPQPELLALSNPQDNRLNGPYKLLDVVLYKGRYYLYHGATPALLLFAPWYLLTHHDLPENFAAFLLALTGYFFLSILFVRIMAFASIRVSWFLFALCLLALGVGQCVPFLLHRVKVYEVAIAGGYCCVGAGFYFLFESISSQRRRKVWAALAGLCFGVAIGCRPHLGLAGLSAFVLLSVCARKNLVALVPPLLACGLAVVSYNYARFGNPFEFGLRYQLADTPYQNIRLSAANVVPGLYYMLLCPPDFVPEFPFVRLAWREPFDAAGDALPPRYFLEPTAGSLWLFPLAVAAFLTPITWKRFRGRQEAFGLLCAMLAFAAASILFIAATGLTSQRFEVDFLPFVVFVGCVVACELLGGLSRSSGIAASAALAVLLLYALGANSALALQGPYDQFVQSSPDEYIALAKWFSPWKRYRPVENPPLRVAASFEFPSPCKAERLPLISTGEFGSRYLLSEECGVDGRMTLDSETAVQSTNHQTIPVPYFAGMNLAAIRFTPRDLTMTVSWNGTVVLRQHLPFLITSPSQIHIGWDPTWGNKVSFPRRIAVYEDRDALSSR